LRSAHQNDPKHTKKLIFSKKNYFFWKRGYNRVSKCSLECSFFKDIIVLLLERVVHLYIINHHPEKNISLFFFLKWCIVIGNLYILVFIFYFFIYEISVKSVCFDAYNPHASCGFSSEKEKILLIFLLLLHDCAF
jgi:hypothetical protein